jgi:hypothetical protein
VNAPRFFLYVALLLLANGAYADGGYQRTRDGKTLVWNNRPVPGDAVAWSGKRDADGYATGYGTLTWFSRTRATMTGSHLSADKYREIGQYSGKMVRGKLDGAVVNVDADGRRFHGTFVDGKKTKDWFAGRAAERQSTEEVSQAELVEAPTEGPSPEEKPQTAEASPLNAPAPETTGAGTQHPIVETPAEGPANSGNDSLRMLTAPPRSLRANIPTDAAPEASVPQMSSSGAVSPRLTAAEVIALADAEARIHGYDLNEYQRPQAQYMPADETWSVLYGKNSDDAMSAKHFSVSVEDRTKKTSLAAER